jgi:hypothetical protein
MLEHLVRAHPALSATALRYPMLLSERFLARFETIRSLKQGWFNFAECTAHLTVEDAAELIAQVVKIESPGFRTYFPALAMEFNGRSAADMIQEFYPESPLVRPLEAIDELIDIGEITRRIRVPLED